ncbi:hypothetical protein J1N35_035609 [Gossypium stocksii]|uniref:Uncharacterized protein n=1 Tax=Gossypium stocksii TaxID=47602 RepID=A0A9D3UW07_9ROSI|nr:hypothetical protein J1N35_035609 [Gossypium stocksii]
MLPKDGVYTTQPIYSERRVNSIQANQFNSHIGNGLPEDGVYIAQLVYSKCRVNLVKSTNLNGHIGSSLPKDGVYTAKSIYLECKVNSLQEKTFNGHVGSSLQDELLRSRILSYQKHDQVLMISGAYNPRTYSTRLIESSMPLRTSTLAPNRQTNPLDVSDLGYRNSLQPRSSMLSNSRSNSQFSMPCLSNSNLYDSKVPEISILQRLQQQEGLLNQHTGIGTSISSIVFTSLLQNEIGDTSTSHQVGTPLSNYMKGGFKLILFEFDEPKREPSTLLLPMPQREPSTLPMPMVASDAECEN